MPCMQQACDRGTPPDDGDNGRGERGRERQGVTRCHGVHGVSTVEEGTLLSGRQWKRLKGSLRQADRQWKATSEFLQLTALKLDQLPPDVGGKSQKKQLGQALNMSDRALKRFQEGFDEVGGDMSLIREPQVVGQLVDMYRHACDLRPNLILFTCSSPNIHREDQFRTVLQQCLQHAVKRGQLFVCLSPDLCAPCSAIHTVALNAAQPGQLHVMTNWPGILERLQSWADRPNVCLEEFVNEVRQALSSYLKVPWQRVHVHD